MRWIVIGCIVSVALAGHVSAVTHDSRMVRAAIVLDQPMDYVLEGADVRGVYDAAALTLRGQIGSVSIRNSRFGQVLAGPDGQAAAIGSQGATVGRFTAVDCEFYDAENELVSLAQGSFGHVVFERCTFRTSRSFLQQIVERNPWRDGPPVAEFANIERLELLDVEFDNTKVIIHPSVKQVILRGDIRQIEVIDPGTQVIRLPAEQTADPVLAILG